MSCLFSSRANARLFFKPVEFHLQLPDLLIELADKGLLVLFLLASLVPENLWQALHHLFLPLGNLVRVDPVFTGNLCNRPVPLDGLQCHFRLELSAEPFVPIRHLPPSLIGLFTMGQDRLTTLLHCPVFGVHYIS